MVLEYSSTRVRTRVPLWYMYVCMYVYVRTRVPHVVHIHTCTYPSTRVRTRILASRSTCTFMVHGKRVLVLGQKKRVLGVPWYLYGIAIHGKRVLVRIKSYCNIAIQYPLAHSSSSGRPVKLYIYIYSSELQSHVHSEGALCRRRPDTRMKNACIWTGSTSITTSALLDCRRRCCVLFVRYVCWRNQSVGTNGY